MRNTSDDRRQTFNRAASVAEMQDRMPIHVKISRVAVRLQLERSYDQDPQSLSAIVSGVRRGCSLVSIGAEHDVE